MAEKDDVQEKTIAEDLVVTKYKMCGEIVNKILKEVVEKCVDGASVRDTCIHGDNRITEETSKVFKKEKEMKKGTAFPTCISVNNCVCHFSPLVSEPDYVLKSGDLVKVDLGGHIDGFIAVVAHSFVVGANKTRRVTGRKADVMVAAHQASEAALRLVKPAGENNAVTDAVQKISESYKCKPIEGMLSHQLQQFKINGEKTIIQNPNEAQRKDHEKAEFDLHEVYAVDVLISTGEGVGREMDSRVTVYKKTEETYMLKMKASRAFFSEVEKKFSTMPFNLRNFDEEKKAKMGIMECVNHKLIEPFQVLYEKTGEFVAQFKFTVLLMPTGPHKITGLPFDTFYDSKYKVQDESIKTLLNSALTTKSSKKKQKKKADKAILNNVDEAKSKGTED